MKNLLYFSTAIITIKHKFIIILLLIILLIKNNNIQYQIRLQNSSNGSGQNFILNASMHANGNDGNQGDDPKCVSVVTLMELAQ